MAAGRRARFDFDASLAELAERLDADGAATDWAWIVGLYDVVARRSVARDRAEPRRGGGDAGRPWRAGLIDTILAPGDLGDYHLAHWAGGPVPATGENHPEITANADIGCYAYPRRETHVPVVHGAEHLV